MKKQTFEEEKEGTHVVINGAMQIQSISLNPDLDKETQERVLADCVNETMKKAQMSMAQKFQGLM